MHESEKTKSKLLFVFIRAIRGRILVFAVMPLIGCVDQKKEVALYRKLLDGSTPTTHPVIDPATPLTLQRALQLADADNETIASSGENYIQALADKMRDAGTFLPTISLAPTYSLSSGGSSGFIIGGSSIGTGSGTGTGTGTGTTGGGSTVQVTGSSGISHQFSVPVTASATGSLANVSTYQSAGQTAEQRAQLLLDERETILLQVVQSYYNVLTAERQTATYEASIKFKSEKVRDQQARLKLGAVRPLDLAQSESDLAATQVSLTQSRTNTANARSTLARLIAVEQVDQPLADEFVSPTDADTIQHWRDIAFAHRPDLAAADRAVQSAHYKVESAIREYFPSVSIDFDYFLYNDPRTGQHWTGGLSANLPIFSALAIEADVRSAWSQYRQAGLSQSQTRRQVVDDVNQAYQNWLNARDEIVELTVEVKAAEQAFDLADRQYRVGGESNLDRLTQQDQLLTAQLNLVSEQLAEKSNYLALLRATGNLQHLLH